MTSCPFSDVRSTYRWILQTRVYTFCLAGLLVACGELQRDPVESETEEEVLPPLFTGGNVNSTCEEDQDCRSGLRCDAGSCIAVGSTPLDGSCILTDECAEDLVCGWAGFCIEAGERELGEACAQDGECQRGAYCERTGGIAGECTLREVGTSDVGESCSSSTDCVSGLVCSPDRDERICLPGSLLLNPDVFRGVACQTSEETDMPFGMRHALPGEGADFFATPFPSDLRMREGYVDLNDYPRPGAALNDRDLFAHLLDRIEELRKGWSRNPGIYLRFTRELDPEQVAEGLEEHFRLIDLETGERHPFEVRFHSARNKYICSNYLFMHPLWSTPLQSGHRYAVLALRSLRSVDGETPIRLDATDTLFETRAPSDSEARLAWERYAPLRTWIEDDQLREIDVIGASVFTVEEDQEVIKRGRDAVYDANPIRFDLSSPPVVCASDIRSPCAMDDGTLERLAERGIERDPRSCPSEENPLFHEIHALVKLPIFQRGQAPYELEGGGVRVDRQGVPILVSYQPVCMAITVPKGVEEPEDGWPVVVYGHGTGGDFRAGIKLLGRPLSSLRTDPDPDMEGEEVGALAPVMMIEIDQVMHGSRLGEDQLLAPGPLFFNVQNPEAARGNLIQGALDNFALVRFITQGSDLHDWNFPELGKLKINRERVSYHGHSQGGTTGPLFAPFEDEITGVAFSGAAGGLMFSLLDKKDPYDATVGLQLALQEFEMNGDHPALHVFQEYFDDVDPINYAERITSKPDGKALHLLHIYGRKDSFTPDSGQRSFAAASGAMLAIATNGEEDFDTIDDLDVVTQSYPILENIELDGVGRYTAAVVQHAPERDGARVLYNGHFVAYRNPEASDQLINFLRDLSIGISPRIDE